MRTMNFISPRQLLAVCFFYFMVSIFCNAGRVDDHDPTPIKAVSLGGWLIVEGWIKPSLFDGIPSKDFLDGTELQFKSVTTGKYLCAEGGGGQTIVANRSVASDWETFRLWRINATHFNLRVFNKQFMGVKGKGNGDDRIVARSKTDGSRETFQIIRQFGNSSRVRIKAWNGLLIRAQSEDLVTADGKDGGWGDDDPSVFNMTISERRYGEFQITNGYGPKKAPKVMKEHWDTFIVEEDFKFIAKHGLNAIRIPVGWWIASDPTPPFPYVGGSLKALDKAFKWAEKYGLKVMVELHGAPGSQNIWEHSGSRDSFQEWGQTDENIQQTVDVIDFLTARYSKSPSLYAIGLLNEPLAPKASFENVTKYYKAGYEAVRKHSSSAYVVLSNRLKSTDPKELFPLTSAMSRSVIDVHFYNMINYIPSNSTIDQNIDFVLKNNTSTLKSLTQPNGPRILIGEWVTEWQIKNATKKDYQNFAKTQLKVYGKASFGWAYWTLKNVNNHWSLEWMIKNGYIKP